MDRNAARSALEAVFTAEDNAIKARQAVEAATATAQQNAAAAENAHAAAKQHLQELLQNG